MLIGKDSVTFLENDMHFVQKYGIAEATEMVLNFVSVNKTPFIFDTYQLAEFFGRGRKIVFETVRNCDEMYINSTISKKNGKERQLSVPYTSLKRMQKEILFRILKEIPISEYATAYKKGARLSDNAAPHVNRKYILKMDITDFFGSINFIKVYTSVFNTTRFPRQIGAMLTTLCCFREALPQGAPTSPAISNIVMKNFDDYIGNWCKERGVAYTRYCDDMTFSSDKPLYGVYRKVKYTLEKMGFEVNKEKTCLVTSSGRQTVTGLTVNEKVSVPKPVRRELRQEVYYALKFGPENAIIHTDKKQFFTNGVPDVQRYRNHLCGKISYVLQTDPQNKWFRDAFVELKKTEMNIY